MTKADRGLGRLIGRRVRKNAAAAALLAALTTGCATERTDLPRGEAAYQMFPSASGGGPVYEYRIGPFDTLDVSVFQEEDLSASGLQVDANGRVSLPLIGAIQAGGKTSTELATLIEDRYRVDYLRNPQVSVNVKSSTSQRVTVDGAVRSAGVFEVAGSVSLIQAIALAGGADRVAERRDVAIFRMIDGTEMAASFDLKAIQRGEAADPVVLGGDKIIVGINNLSQAYQDFLRASPLVASVVRPVVQ